MFVTGTVAAGAVEPIVSFVGVRMEESCVVLVRLGRGEEIGDVRSGGGGVDIFGG